MNLYDFSTPEIFLLQLKEIWKRSNNQRIEYSGIISDTQIEITQFGDRGFVLSENVPMAFHTHPTFPVSFFLEEEDRYSPPSGVDTMDVMNGNRKHEYVLTERGVWEINRLEYPDPLIQDSLLLYFQVLKIHFMNDIYPFKNSFDETYIIDYLHFSNQINFRKVFWFIQSDKKNSDYLNYINDQLKTFMGHQPLTMKDFRLIKEIDQKKTPVRINFIPYTEQEEI